MSSGLQKGDEPSTETVERQVSAGARNTIADMMQTYEQVMGVGVKESEKWLNDQIAVVAALRERVRRDGR